MTDTAAARHRSQIIRFLFGLSILLLSARAAAQNERASDSSFASPGNIGIGIRAGIVHFSGDVTDALDFSGARTPFHGGADLLFHARLFQATQGSSAMRIGVEAAAGYRVLNASHPTYSFTTRAYPASASMTIEFYSMSFVRPFVSLGIGVLPYSLAVGNSMLTGDRAKQAIASESSVAFWLPLRIGVRFTVSSALDLHATVERSVTLTDRLDGIVTKDLSWMNDNFESIALGFTFYFLGDRSGDPYGQQLLVPRVVPPSPPDPATLDSDGDGLTDSEERTLYHTDPMNADTDGDGLPDGQEIKRYKTNPLLADSDGDGLTDGEEIRLGTNPNSRDTDGDGIPDGVDKCPLEAETVNGYKDDDGCPDDEERGEILFQKLGDILILENIEFELGKAALLSGSNATLDKIVRSLKNNPSVSIEIRGHTDSTGDMQSNITLSSKRAESVKAYIVSHGIESERISTVGLGPTQPIAPNNSPEGRQRNRRIEFRIVKID